MAAKGRYLGTLTWKGFFIRLSGAMVLVFATYNPEGYSYYHWVKDNLSNFNALLAVAGVALLIGWAIFVRATFRSLGPIGVSLAVALFASLVWLLVERDLISPDSPRIFSYIVLTMVSLVLGVGISWSFVRRRLTGQLDVDEVD